MSENNIRRIAITGTGVIGASWAAYYLARGLEVVATDPAPGAEANLRRFVSQAWPALVAQGLSPGASVDRLKFTPDLKRAVSEAQLIQENGPERPEFKIKLFADIDAASPPDAIIASSSSGITERHAVWLQAPRAGGAGPSFQRSLSSPFERNVRGTQLRVL